MTTTTSSMANQIWASTETNKWLRVATLALCGSIFVALCARIQVPMWPVPMTMQTFAVLFIGLAFGGRIATATMLTYLAEGAAGLPVFANGGGIAYFSSPTAGYLFGFLLAATAVGYLADRGWDRSALRVSGALAIGTALIFVPGVAWLSGFIGLQDAIAGGLLPFLPGEVVKAALAAMCILGLWRMFPVR